jgi:hypothetical protein
MCLLLALPLGIALLLSLPAALWLRCLFCGAWLANSVREYRDLRDGAARVRRIALDALDNIAGITPGGQREPLELLHGSVVLSRLAWLRVRFPDGRHYVECLHGDPAADLEWQRLQLIWRLRRTVFGAQDGS